MFGEAGRAEEHEQLVEASLPECEEEQVAVASARKRIPYANPAQEEAGRKRGRRKLLGRTALSSRVSLDTLIAAQPKDLAERLMTAGFLVLQPAQFQVQRREVDSGDARLVLLLAVPPAAQGPPQTPHGSPRRLRLV